MHLSLIIRKRKSDFNSPFHARIRGLAKLTKEIKLKKTFLLCLTLLVVMPSLTDFSNAAPRQSEKRYCRRNAENYADRRSAGNTAGGAIGGAVVGGILGGLITGGKGRGVGTGAAVGAGVGGVSGAVRSSQRWKNRYWKKYNSCIKKYS